MNPQKIIKLLEQYIYQPSIIAIMLIIVIAYILYRLHWAYNPVQRYWRRIQCERYMYKLNEKYTDYIASMPFSDVITTTNPVISYEMPIPTNPTQETQDIKLAPPNLFSFVEPNKIPPGHYNDSKLDLLVTNGLFTIGSNWVYDAVFAV